MKRCSILMSVIILGIILLFPTSLANAAIVFQDNFEDGNLNDWTGQRTSNGESIAISGYRSYIGAYGVKASSNGGGGVEYAYCYKTVTAPVLTVQARFFLSKLGIDDNGDRIYLISFQTGTNTLATAGIRKVDGILKWFVITRDGSKSVIAYSNESPQQNTFYTIALTWSKDSTNGGASLWVTELESLGDNSRQLCALSDRNTALYGDTKEIRIGLPTVSYCSSTTVYFDEVDVHNDFSSNTLSTWQLINRDGTDLFSDNLETGTFQKWSGINTYNGGSARITNSSPASGNYSAQFMTSGSTSYGQAYCYKLIPKDFLDFGNALILSVDIKISSYNFPGNNGKITLIRGWNGNTEVLSAGLEKTNGEIRWFYSIPGETVYSNSEPKLNSWYSIGVGFATYVYSAGIHSQDGSVNEHLEMYFDGSYNVDRVDVGLAKLTSCRTASVSVDNFHLSARVLE